MITATLLSNGTISLVGKQGTNWDLEIELYEDDERTIPWDVSTYLARGQYRKNYKVTSEVLIPFVCSIQPYHATTNPDNNKILITVLPDVSSACTVLSGVYDIEIYNGDDIVERVLEGKLTISPEVTKEV